MREKFSFSQIFMKNVLRNTFHVPEGLLIDRVREEPNGDTTIVCHPKKQYVKCPHCSGLSIGHDRRTVRKKHTVVGGKTIWLEITRRRMRCQDSKCRKIFVEPIEGVQKRMGCTDHMNQQIQERSKGQDYTRVAKEFGVCVATVSNRVGEMDIPEFKIPKKKN